MHNIDFSSEKSYFVWIGWENMHRSSTIYKQKQSKAVLNKYFSDFWCEMTTGDGLFPLENVIMYYCYLARIDGLKLKCLNDGFVSYKRATFHFTRH